MVGEGRQTMAENDWVPRFQVDDGELIAITRPIGKDAWRYIGGIQRGRSIEPPAKNMGDTWMFLPNTDCCKMTGREMLVIGAVVTTLQRVTGGSVRSKRETTQDVLEDISQGRLRGKRLEWYVQMV